MNFVKQQSVTRDAFLGGAINLSQPEKGFRAGLDSVLLGASVRPGSANLLDLGAGVGTAALVALTHHRGLFATLAEADAAMAELAAHNVAENGLNERVEIIRLDVTAKGATRLAAGLRSDHYATVIANPPFFDPGAGTAPAAPRAAARHMGPEQLDLWIKTAAASAAPQGEVIFIHVAASLGLLVGGFEARFGAVTILPLAPREGEPASRMLIRGVKGSRAPLILLPARALHEITGRAFRPEFDAIFKGQARLDW